MDKNMIFVIKFEDIFEKKVMEQPILLSLNEFTEGNFNEKDDV